MTLKGTEAKQMISSGDKTLEPNLLRSINSYSSLYLLFGHWTLDFRHWILDVGHWTLDIEAYPAERHVMLWLPLSIVWQRKAGGNLLWKVFIVGGQQPLAEIDGRDK